ncbi:MAG: hypothetical protein R6V46_08900 [Desulfatiglandaceae bacterium]
MADSRCSVVDEQESCPQWQAIFKNVFTIAALYSLVENSRVKDLKSYYCLRYLFEQLPVGKTECDLCTVDPLPKLSGALKPDNPSALNNHIFAGFGVSSSSLRFFFHLKFPEPGNKHIFAIFKVAFNNFQKRTYNFIGFFLGKS